MDRATAQVWPAVLKYDLRPKPGAENEKMAESLGRLHDTHTPKLRILAVCAQPNTALHANRCKHVFTSLARERKEGRWFPLKLRLR